MQLLHSLRSHIQYKIILPFLLLTLLVMLAGSAVSVLFLTNSAQDRLNNQLAQAARSTSDSIVTLERTNLQFLRELTFAPANPQAGARSMADAFSSASADEVAKALRPYYDLSVSRTGVRVDRMIAFDAQGRSLIDWERVSGSQEPAATPSRDLKALWFVPAILGKQNDALGDKYSGLLDLGSDQSRYLFTVAPVLQGEQVVGGVLIASRLDDMIRQIAQDSSAAIVTVYRPEDGVAFASSLVPEGGIAQLQIEPRQLTTVQDVRLAENQSVIDTLPVNARDYQFAYVPLRIRGELVGIVSVSLASDYVFSQWWNASGTLMGLTILLMLAIIGLGVFVARQITRPLQELAFTAESVAEGDLDRRSSVHAHDELGILSRSFNRMTEHLVDLYGEVRSESSQRAAIVESIADGVVVCDLDGRVMVINKAMRDLLSLAEEDAPPARFNDIQMEHMAFSGMSFGEKQSPDLFTIGSHIVRISVAPVSTPEGARLGDVYVFQDLTSEVAIDRAKTNFIATISHELRTPLTVLGGSADLLMRGFVGDLNEEQQSLVTAIHRHATSMTSVLNNVIVIAGLESGTLEFVFAPLSLRSFVEDLVWRQRFAFQAKSLKVEVQIPEDLPDVMADEHQITNVINQLLDNARRYTDAGSIRIAASQDGNRVRVDISDTGPGIDDEVSANLFNRFVRGTEGINSQERGIGLGLAIARMLLERQGGIIWLESTSSQGSTFSFTLPCAYAEPQNNNQVLAQVA